MTDAKSQINRRYQLVYLIEDPYEPEQELLKNVGNDNNMVQIRETIGKYIETDDTVKQFLERRWGVCQTKLHTLVLEEFSTCC